MNTSVLSPGAAVFLNRVRQLLDDLAEEDREEVLQDLEAHLADLGDADLEHALGAPEAFVAEFRSSAGLEPVPHNRIGALLERAQQRRDVLLARPLLRRARTELDRLGPAWMWLRGWLAVTLWALATNNGAVFERFPIPAVDANTTAGLLLTASATWISVASARRSEWFARFSRRFLSAAAAVMVLYAVIEPLALVEGAVIDETRSEQYREQPYSYGGLVGPSGVISNIHAYDLAGNPVEVLLYDQNGSPISISQDMGSDGTQMYDAYGAVRFAYDAYGQPIANLFPLQRLGETWSDDGSAVSYDPLPPPRVALPTLEDAEPTPAPTVVVPERGGR